MCTDIDQEQPPPKKKTPKNPKNKKREKSCQPKILFQTIDKDAQHIRLVHATMKHLKFIEPLPMPKRLLLDFFKMK